MKGILRLTGAAPFCACLCLGCGAPSSGSPPPPDLGIRYEVKDLGAPKGTISVAYALNDKGEVVGQLGYRPFVYVNGAMKRLGTFGGQESAALGINNAGQVVGRSQTAAGFSHAFLYSNGKMRDLGTLGGKVSVAEAINDSGQIVGKSQIAGKGYTQMHAFLWSNGKMVDLGALWPGEYSEAKGINAKGVIVGSSTTGYRSSGPVAVAVRWIGGRIDDLTTGAPMKIVRRKEDERRRRGRRPPDKILDSEACGIASDGRVAGTADIQSAGRCLILCADGKVTAISEAWQVNGINDSGLIVGNGGSSGAFLYRKGSFYNVAGLCLGPNNWMGLRASAVNNAGQIAATAPVDKGFYFRAVMLTAVPTEWKPN